MKEMVVEIGRTYIINKAHVGVNKEETSGQHME